MFELLVKKPEQEARLLAALVNKLGDPARKVASNAAYLLSQLLLQHPAMKPVVVREVSDVPGIVDVLQALCGSIHAQYLIDMERKPMLPYTRKA